MLGNHLQRRKRNGRRYPENAMEFITAIRSTRSEWRTVNPIPIVAPHPCITRENFRSPR